MVSHTVRTIRVGTFVAVAASALAFSGGTAFGGVPYTTMQWFASGESQPPNIYDLAAEASTMTPIGGGAWQFLGAFSGGMQPGGGDPYWALDWNVTSSGNSGGAASGGGNSAFVTADLQITNFTATSQIFFGLVTVTLDSPITGGTFINGSATAGVNGFGGTPASIFTPTNGDFTGNPVYTAFIDGVEVHTLFDSPFQLSTPGGPVSTSETYGDPVPLPGPSEALTTISVLLTIEVSAFATASVTGTLIVIPAPAGLALFAGLPFLGRRRRRD